MAITFRDLSFYALKELAYFMGRGVMHNLQSTPSVWDFVDSSKDGIQLFLWSTERPSINFNMFLSVWPKIYKQSPFRWTRPSSYNTLMWCFVQCVAGRLRLVYEQWFFHMAVLLTFTAHTCHCHFWNASKLVFAFQPQHLLWLTAREKNAWKKEEHSAESSSVLN